MRPASAVMSRAVPSRAQATTHLVLAAATIAALFGALLVAPLPIWSAQPAKPPATGAPGAEPVGWVGLLIPAAFVVALCVPFRPYVHAQALVTRTQVPLRALLGATLLLALTAVLMFPGYGSDIFDYVGFERMWVVYGDNPLLALPINHPQDWATAYVWYPDRTPAYGPLWALITWPIVRLAGDSPQVEVLGYKLLSIAAYAACCCLIWAILDTAQRQRGLIAFAWSPLVLFEVLGKVHNDVLPALAILAALWLVKRRQAALSFGVAVAGGLVKATALAVLPPMVIFLWRRGAWKTLFVATIVALVVLVALYAPFWQGPQTLQPIWNQTSRIVWSPATLLIVLTGAPTAVRILAGVVWLSICGLVLVRRRDTADVAATSGWVLLATLLLLTSAVFSHYLVPAVALAAVAQDERFRKLVMWLSMGALAAYAVELLSLTFGPDWIGSDAYRVAGSLTLLAPSAALLPWRAVARRR